MPSAVNKSVRSSPGTVPTVRHWIIFLKNKALLKMTLKEALREAEALLQVKEDENTRMKINSVLVKVIDEIKGQDDARSVFSSVNDLVQRSIMSERSKLAGTALHLLKTCISMLKNEFSPGASYLGPLVKICGKSNRVFYSRGEDVFVVLCKFVGIGCFYRFFADHASSANKNVRSAVFKGIESGFDMGGDMGLFAELVLKGRGDPFQDVRETCRRLAAKHLLGTDGEKISCVAKPADGAEREAAKVVRQPVRAMFVPQRSVVQQPLIVKKDLVSKFSPARKYARIEGTKAYDKIRELEKEIKDITGTIRPQKDGRGVDTTKLMDKIAGLSAVRIKAGPVKIEAEQDELTPVRLDRYLSKYRDEYGMPHKKDGSDVIRSGVPEVETVVAKEASGGEETFCEKDCVMNTVDGSGMPDVMEGENESEAHNTRKVDDLAAAESVTAVSAEESGQSNELVINNEEGDLSLLSDAGDGCAENLSRSIANISINEAREEEAAEPSQSLHGETGGPEHGCTIANSGNPSGKNIPSPVFNGVEQVLEAGGRSDPQIGCCGGRKIFDLNRNRFSRLLEFDDNSDEETILADVNRNARLCEDANLSFADRISQRDIPEKSRSGPGTSPLQNPINRDAVSSSFLHEPFLAKTKRSSKKLCSDGLGRISPSLYATDEARAEEGDFTFVDAFVQINRKVFRKESGAE
jgi:hypothetical protein